VAPALSEARYRLLFELREGGFARVYLALDTGSGRDCAIQVLRQDGPGEDRQERYGREGEVLTRLDHPNLVTLEAVGQDYHNGDGAPELVVG
jgi:eukaryotic-like serine/threonine-protein kinase